jgi:iron-sulfur cluster insertion protein
MLFTQKAKDKIVEIAGAEKIVDPIVRIKVLGGGCAGFQYDMAFLDSQEMYDPDSDEVYEMGEFTVVVDPISYQYVSEAEVDWMSDGAIREGFKFNNPQVKSSCGCGNSVSF